MNSIALDTNAYRALFDGNAKLAHHIRTATEVGVPVTVLGELFFGIFDGAKSTENSARLRKFLGGNRVQILQINEDTARNFGEIAAELKALGKPIQQNDIWIAALCKQHGFALATSDKGFDFIKGLEVIDF